MTLLGKLVVIGTLCMSLFLMTFSLGVYTNRVDFAVAPAGSPTQVDGEIKKRQEQVKQAWEALRAPEAAFASARPQLLALEAKRPVDRKWFAEELKFLVNGATDKDNPVRMTVLGADGKPTFDTKTGLPKMDPGVDGAGNPLMSREVYDKQAAEAAVSIAQAGEKYIKAKEEAEKLTTLLVGDKGLPQRVRREQIKWERLRSELSFLAPAVVNTAIEEQVLIRRRGELEKRIRELERIGVATR